MSQGRRNLDAHAVMKLICSSVELAKTVNNDPKFASKATQVMADAAEVAMSVTESTRPKLMVEVPEDIKQLLKDIQQGVSNQEKLIYQLQGMIMSMPRQSAYVESQTRPTSTYPTRQNESEKSSRDILDELFDSVRHYNPSQN